MKSLCCAFTGHRPSKFRFGFDEEHPACQKIKASLAQQIAILIEQGVTQFFSGMAQGTDQWAAEIVLDLKQRLPDLKLSCILPCETQADKWSAPARERYFDILAQADDVIYISHYTDTCMMERNRFMIDRSQFVIAVYDGGVRSGTAVTVSYTRRKNRTLILIDPATGNVISLEPHAMNRYDEKGNIVDLGDYRKS